MNGPHLGLPVCSLWTNYWLLCCHSWWSAAERRPVNSQRSECCSDSSTFCRPVVDLVQRIPEFINTGHRTILNLQCLLYQNVKFWLFLEPLLSDMAARSSSVHSFQRCPVTVLFRIISKLSTGSSIKMDGIWNRYNLKSTGRIYTFGVLKCSETFEVLDLPQYISIYAPFVALETSKRNSISCHVFWIMSRVTVSMADVILSCRCWIFLIFSAYTLFLMYPHRKKNQV